jgi:hypothetical protein
LKGSSILNILPTPKNTESVFIIEEINKIMSFRLIGIEQGLINMVINSKYGFYSLKHTAINKLFRLNLTLQIKKVERYALNLTMVLVHYNPTIQM